MKTIGIIGGFGPEATAQFYLKLVDATRKANHGTQPRLLMRNVSVPSRMEHDALILGKNLNQFIPLLTSAAADLEHNGADIVVLPCNTLHIHETAIQNAITIPFVSIISSSVRFLRIRGISNVGFLGSRITIRDNLFKRQANEITFITVDTQLQRQIDKGLNLFVGTQNPVILRNSLSKAFNIFSRKNIQNVLLACTDFGRLCPVLKNIKIHDTIDILVAATVNAT